MDINKIIREEVESSEGTKGLQYIVDTLEGDISKPDEWTKKAIKTFKDYQENTPYEEQDKELKDLAMGLLFKNITLTWIHSSMKKSKNETEYKGFQNLFKEYAKIPPLEMADKSLEAINQSITRDMMNLYTRKSRNKKYVSWFEEQFELYKNGHKKQMDVLQRMTILDMVNTSREKKPGRDKEFDEVFRQYLQNGDGVKVLENLYKIK